MKNIAVFFGGVSVEHDVSVITGVMTLNSLDRLKYNPVPVFVSNKGEWFTGEILFDLDNYKALDQKKLKRVTFFAGENVLYSVKKNKLKAVADIAVAINCMHGERGEDGALAGLTAMCKIPLASPNMLASSVCMDKSFTKTVLSGLKVKALPSYYLEKEEQLLSLPKKLTYPLIVKPNRLGSSVGINVAEDEKQLKSAFRYAKRFGEGAIIEPCLTGFKEINCAAYRRADGKITVSECEQPIGRTEILSFNDKYKGGKRVFPADIEEKFSNKIKETTLKVYSALGCSGVIRIDYFIKGEEIYLNEINTVPGSLAHYLFVETMKDFSLMLDDLIAVAEVNFAKESTLVTKNHTDILSGVGSKGAKRN